MAFDFDGSDVCHRPEDECLSRLKGNFHERFLGEGTAATYVPSPDYQSVLISVRSIRCGAFIGSHDAFQMLHSCNEGDWIERDTQVVLLRGPRACVEV